MPTPNKCIGIYKGNSAIFDGYGNEFYPRLKRDASSFEFFGIVFNGKSRPDVGKKFDLFIRTFHFSFVSLLKFNKVSVRDIWEFLECLGN
ncbi:hypothetical protein P872_15240 [Rhodonellum psychrophilum GCM71 = DSM 17998]|uniref:Uncharacterized protein n=2 Tax=Rhodonellum TaxID=336827 RepID=U5C5C5_9BACT|nr:hypothetical protein P872_15240 [Rhodonellum psychrophilum GCM71 = DSM 17998]SDZ20323.1 hypothetical protein SAMN05444412_107173 [Rhodonellum ikkaensis]